MVEVKERKVKEILGGTSTKVDFVRCGDLSTTVPVFNDGSTVIFRTRSQEESRLDRPRKLFN